MKMDFQRKERISLHLDILQPNIFPSFQFSFSTQYNSAEQQFFLVASFYFQWEKVLIWRRLSAERVNVFECFEKRKIKKNVDLKIFLTAVRRLDALPRRHLVCVYGRVWCDDVHTHTRNIA